jgi:hypothetical protein
MKQKILIVGLLTIMLASISAQEEKVRSFSCGSPPDFISLGIYHYPETYLFGLFRLTYG